MMVERVLDTRISDVSESGDVAEVSGQVTTVFSDLHLSLQSKKYDKLLSANGFDTTVGALLVVTAKDLLELASILRLGVGTSEMKFNGCSGVCEPPPNLYSALE